MTNLQDTCPIIGVGASAGGLEAVNEMLGRVPENAHMAFVIIQHLDPNHESMMAELMDRRTGLHVTQIEGGEAIEPGHAYVIPPGFNVQIDEGVLSLIAFDEPRGMRRPIDDFFTSLAMDQGANAACVILSGTGSDGTAGLRKIKDRDGLCIVQKPDAARYDGMPVSAISTGLVDFVLAASEIYDQLAAFFETRHLSNAQIEAQGQLIDNMDEICAILHDNSGHDFSGYKRNTLNRRTMRRMQLTKVGNARHYVELLRKSPDECEALLKDLLINVTNFFRDDKVFEILQQSTIRDIVSGIEDGGNIRVWVAGCSSGEEAYSLAMLFADQMKRQNKQQVVQIFATDIDDQMLAQAREGRYSASELKDLPPLYRDAYTFGSDGYFEINASIRDMIHFSSHSLIKDPPFFKLDMISCRNLLIYLGDEVQRSLIPLFHYALKQDGILLLGTSESIGRRDDLFEPINAKARIFRRMEGKGPYPIELPVGLTAKTKEPPKYRYSRYETAESFEVAPSVKRILERYAPSSVHVNVHGDILNTNGRMSKFLDYPSGSPTTHLLTIARPGLREILSPMMREAIEDGRRKARTDVDVVSEFGTQTIDLVVDPLEDGSLLIVLSEVGKFRDEVKDDLTDPALGSDRVHDLEEELRHTRFRLRSAVEELETANEELKSSNEEMMSMNEELQSANEELSTVNEEIKNKADQLAVVNDDMRHFLDSTEIALVILDKDFRVRTFTKPILNIYPLQRADRGRPLSEVMSTLNDSHIFDDAEKVLEGHESIERLVTSKNGGVTYSMRILPYRTQSRDIEGVTLTFNDVSSLHSMEDELRIQTSRLRVAMSAAGIGAWNYDPETGETDIDHKVRELFGVPEDGEFSSAQMIDRMHEADRERVRSGLEKAASGGGEWREVFRIPTEEGDVRWIVGQGRMEKTADGQSRMYGVNFDISSERSALAAKELLLGELNHRVKNLFAIISSIVALAGRQYEDTDEMVETVRNRIAALGRAHEATQNDSGYESVMLGELLKTIVAPYAADNDFIFKGSEVSVPTDTVTPIGLIVHEWATNAAKYGALKESEGSVQISWFVTQTDTGSTSLELEWSEEGGPTVSRPEKHEGFGTRLIESSARQLRAEVETEWRESGVLLRMSIPFSEMPSGDRI